MLYGYARISTVFEKAKDKNQTFERQLKILKDYGIKDSNIYKDRITGGSNTENRKGYNELMATMMPGDTIVVTEISRFSRSLSDLIFSINELLKKQIGIIFIKEHLEFGTDESNAMAKFQLHLFGAIAEFEKSLIQNRVKEGLEAARQKGKRLGRPTNLTDVMEEQIIFDYMSGSTYDELESKYNISRPTIARICKPHTKERRNKLKLVVFK